MKALMTLVQAQQINEPSYIEYQDDGNLMVYTGPDIPLNFTPRVISVTQFRDRFTSAELSKLLALAYAGDVNTQSLLLQIQTASYGVNLDSVTVSQGLDYITTKLVIVAGRKVEILA